ncbi:MAG: CRISPR-associated protein Csb2 [Acidobacteriota bacterium]|jgi:CRISPR-associated protein Csb2|nr:CRISPR-associated protein Csb2 [Acidobacteriota bacterium]
MIAIRMRFLTGRFHATPWGHHVNEGAVEYPPSVWRLMRSLVATFYRVFPERAHQDEGDNLAVTQLKRIVAALSSPPEFYLPNAVVAHTRHYDQDNKGVKFFDTFVGVNPEDEMLWIWRDADLREEDHAALAELLGALGTFGRAESWCEAKLLSAEDDDALLAKMDGEQGINSRPLAANTNLAGLETMRLLLPDANADADKLFKTLLTETAKMRKGKQLEPTGTRWVTYTRPSDIFKPRRVRKPKRPETKRYTVARFALSSEVLPLVTEALPMAEMARFAVSSRRADESYSLALAGKTEGEGKPLREDHAHAHFWATDEDADGRLDHLTVYAPREFDADDVDALGRVRVVKRHYKNLPDVRLVLLGMGGRDDFAHVPVFRTARRWRSVTPFSLPRYASRGGGKRARPRDLPEAQLRRELRLHGLPEPVSVMPLDGYRTGDRREVRWLEFQTRRFKGEQGYGLAGFEVEFAEETAGPLALGFGCHFGLGLFEPVRD